MTYRLAGDAAAVDQLRHGELPRTGQRPHRRRRVVAEHAEGVQQLVEVRALLIGDGADLTGDVEQFQAVTDTDVGDDAALGRHDGRDALHREPSGGLPDRTGLTPCG